MKTPTRKTPCGDPECIECYGNPEYTEEQIEVLNECKFVEDNLGSVSDVTRKLIHRLIECDTLVKREVKTDRRPVGNEPVAWISRIRCVGPDFGKEMYGKLPIQSLQAGFYEHIPLYAHPPAQTVDLEQFRRPLKVARAAMEWSRNDEAVAECDRLLALIDQQAVGGARND